ncbi:hypothetical protein GCK32_010038 [Trichostrongylus colubriformis]|uniref:Protein lifeguard 1 n=1 Tax=Trichostrongylus colubriformis TaxID=6319 RepID=A0AAN8F763_TRICO
MSEEPADDRPPQKRSGRPDDNRWKDDETPLDLNDGRYGNRPPDYGPSPKWAGDPYGNTPPNYGPSPTWGGDPYGNRPPGYGPPPNWGRYQFGDRPVNYGPPPHDWSGEPYGNTPVYTGPPQNWSGYPYANRNPYYWNRASYDSPDVERFAKDEFGFDNASIRAGFVRKVFAIVTVMGLVNVLMVTPVVVNTELRLMVKEHSWMYLIAFIIFLTSYCTLICCRSVARSFPTNLIILAFFTIAAGMMLMVLCAKASPQAVLLAVITTTICCTAIILFATQTSIDITSYIFIIFAASIAVFIFGVVLAILSIFMYIKALHIIFSAVVCVLFMVYLAVDIQLIVGGRKYEISPEEYVFAALMLFVDIYEIFITLLSLFQQAE